ncbi:hypothetical protein QUC31_002211 [Theobroma cacao]
MRVLQRVKGKLRREMGLAPALVLKLGTSYVRSRGRSMKLTRNWKMVGLAMVIRSHQLNLQR